MTSGERQPCAAASSWRRCAPWHSSQTLLVRTAPSGRGRPLRRRADRDVVFGGLRTGCCRGHRRRGSTPPRASLLRRRSDLVPRDGRPVGGRSRGKQRDRQRGGWRRRDVGRPRPRRTRRRRDAAGRPSRGRRSRCGAGAPRRLEWCSGSDCSQVALGRPSAAQVRTRSGQAAADETAMPVQEADDRKPDGRKSNGDDTGHEI